MGLGTFELTRTSRFLQLEWALEPVSVRLMIRWFRSILGLAVLILSRTIIRPR